MSSPAFTILRMSDSLEGLREQLVARLPSEPVRRILIKPNWVRHAESENFPIEALVTNPALIDVVLQACLEKYPEAERITVADVPLQTCDWPRLCRQAGVAELMSRYGGVRKPVIEFLDLRRERFVVKDGFFERDEGETVDPAEYCEVVLDDTSFLEAVSGPGVRFCVSDYDARVTASHQHRGRHRYRILRRALEADLVVNLPKIKTHQKAGITCALKNLVGINGEKAYLVHHRRGFPRTGGDEFAPGTSPLIFLQTRIRELLQKRSSWGFRLARLAWRGLKALAGIRTEGTREALGKTFYVASGSWYGNDTIWRMVYDLNKIVRYAPAGGGRLARSAQRQCVVVLDGLTAGEGNGPLQPLPVSLGVVGIGDDPFAADMAVARLIGFDYRKIPLLAHHREFGDVHWGAFDPASVELRFDGRIVRGVDSLPVLKAFESPPGWRGHIEGRGTP